MQSSAPHEAAGESDSIQGRGTSESRKEYLRRVLDRVTELGERKPAAKKEVTPCIHGKTTPTSQPPPPPPSYDEATALGLFLDEKLALDDGTTKESTSYATASSHSHDNNSRRRSLRRSRPSPHTSSQEDERHTQIDRPSHQQPRHHRSAPKGSLVERAHSLASEESVRAEMERIQRDFADHDEDTSTKVSRSTNRSSDSMYKYPPALESPSINHEKGEEESESEGSLLLVTKRENLPSIKDAQSRPYIG